MTTYNGWTNYATWRINLEIFDDFDPYDHFSDDQAKLADNLPDYLKDYAEELICALINKDALTLAENYALAFMQDVNWREIAEHLINDYAEDEVTE
jgi:hypothetical protein